MHCICNLKTIYGTLNEIKFDLLCDKTCSCHECEDYCIEEDYCHHENECCECCHCHKDKYCLSETRLIRVVVKNIMDDKFCTEKQHEWDGGCHCISLLDALMMILCEIEEDTCCKKNYGYLLQIDKLECILSNFKNLLCQLKCLSSNDCDLIAKVLCTLFKSIDLLESIIAKIKNIECLCKSHLCCECELIKCIVCDLEEEINCLEKTISDLACIVFEIASKEILNCTSCGVSECTKDKKKNYLNKYCKANCFCEEICNKKY